jgi:hypothetical protein
MRGSIVAFALLAGCSAPIQPTKEAETPSLVGSCAPFSDVLDGLQQGFWNLPDAQIDNIKLDDMKRRVAACQEVDLLNGEKYRLDFETVKEDRHGNFIMLYSIDGIDDAGRAVEFNAVDSSLTRVFGFSWL